MQQSPPYHGCDVRVTPQQYTPSNKHIAVRVGEEQMIEEVDMNLSRRAMENDKRFCARLGEELIPYLYHLGSVVGTIGKRLTFMGDSTH
jgi:hypothetical protein